MNLSPDDLIDKMSILKLKIEGIGEPHLSEEYEEYKRAIEIFKENGIEIKSEWFDKLYEANKVQWEIYVQLNKEKNENKNLEKIGRLYVAVEKSNKKRVAIKNEIVEATGKGCRDIKMN